MSAQENKALIRQYLAAISGQDKPPEVVDRYIADSDQELKEAIAYSEASFPHWELIADDMVAEGDKVAVRGTIRGTHEGEWMGLAPTHKTVTLAIMRIYRIADGKIAEHWSVADEMSLMQQLGAIPGPG